MGTKIKFYQRKDEDSYNDRGNQWNDRRDRSNSRQREIRNERSHREAKPKPRKVNIPEGLSSYNVFLFGYSPEVKERDMKDGIVNQTGLTCFRLRLRVKVDESGNTKTFGFVEFTNREDCISFLETPVEVNG